MAAATKPKFGWNPKFDVPKIVGFGSVGLLLGAGYALWRTTDWGRNDPLEGIEPRPKNWVGLCEDMPPHVKKLIKEVFPYVPAQHRPLYKEMLRRVILEIDQIMCIELQVEGREQGPPSYERDFNEARLWALDVMRMLRYVQTMFPAGTQIHKDVLETVAHIGGIIARHLQNIHVSIREYLLSTAVQQHELDRQRRPQYELVTIQAGDG
jgi:hypothetical protein